jgi:DNA-binding NarL/FixJ family response regulator
MTEPEKIRVFSVDDHPLLREGVAAIINSQPDMIVVAQAASGRDAIQQYRECQPDVTLMDLRLPDLSGIDAMIAIRSEFPDARIVMLTTFEGDVEIQRALSAGARGYVLKSMPPGELADAIRQVFRGRKRIPAEVAAHLAEHMGDELLTERERDVLQQVAGGSRNREIGERLFISEETVKVHMKHIMEKLGASDRTEAVTIAVRRGIIHL